MYSWFFLELCTDLPSALCCLGKCTADFSSNCVHTLPNSVTNEGCYFSFCKSSFDHLLRCPKIARGRRLSNANKSYFIEVSILEKLQNMFRRPGFCSKLQHRFSCAERHQCGIEDVYDGQLYPALMKPGQYLANPHNISFQLNADKYHYFTP